MHMVLSPLAYLELLFHCHHADTEVAAMGISAENQPLRVERIELVRQSASTCFVEMDDEAVADHIDDCAQLGIPPARCGRIWMHTHPGNSAEPSVTDEQTFRRAFGGCDWSVMFILARGGQMYAGLQFAALSGARMTIPVTIDWSVWPTVAMELLDPVQVQAWYERHMGCVRSEPVQLAGGLVFDHDLLDEAAWRAETDEMDAEYALAREMLEAQGQAGEMGGIDA